MYSKYFLEIFNLFVIFLKNFVCFYNFIVNLNKKINKNGSKFLLQMPHERFRIRLFMLKFGLIVPRILQIKYSFNNPKKEPK